MSPFIGSWRLSVSTGYQTFTFSEALTFSLYNSVGGGRTYAGTYTYNGNTAFISVAGSQIYASLENGKLLSQGYVYTKQ
jgi:hypothetical protein